MDTTSAVPGGESSFIKTDLLLVQCDHLNCTTLDNINCGILSIASYVESRGYSVKIITSFDYHTHSNKELGEYIRTLNPAATGFYLISDNIELVLNQSVRIRELVPSTVILMGGPLATSMGERLLEYSFIDGVVLNEGEYTTEEILRSLRQEGKLPENTPGLIIRKGDGIHGGLPPRIIEDLDALPSPDVKNFSRSNFFRVISGRGCPYKCTFCYQSSFGLKARFRSAERVLEEVTGYLDAYPFQSFAFVDDAFILDRERCIAIAEGLIRYREEKKRDFLFFCQGRANVLDKNPEIIHVLARAGLARMQLGIETGDPGILEYYRKMITADQVRRVVGEIRETESVVANGGFILGGPFETEKTFGNTLELALELIELAPGAFFPSAGFLSAYPGTEIAEAPEKYGLFRVEQDFSRFASLTDVQFVTDAFPAKEQIRGLKTRFQDETRKAMARVLHRIPRRLLELHYTWGRKGFIYSNWYSEFLSQLGAAGEYFRCLTLPGFKALGDIPADEFSGSYPMRTIGEISWSREGIPLLPPSVREVSLDTREEILVYEMSSGTRSMREIARVLQETIHRDREIPELLGNVVIPAVRKLEESFFLVIRES